MHLPLSDFLRIPSPSARVTALYRIDPFSEFDQSIDRGVNQLPVVGR